MNDDSFPPLLPETLRRLGRALAPHGLVGIIIMAASTALAALGVEPAATWYRPLMGWGFLLFLDSVLLRLRGCSLLRGAPPALVWMAPLSVALWLVFEAYNLLLRNWAYAGAPEDTALRFAWHAASFSTVLPALFLTAEFMKAVGWARPRTLRPVRVTESILYGSMAAGAVMLVVPALFPSPYLFGLVLLGFVFLLEPVNYIFERPSLLRDLEEGKCERLFAWLWGGYACGFLWEIWNYGAAGQWRYSVPLTTESLGLPALYVFEMPLTGFLGYGPFALEIFSMYHTACLLLGRRGREI
ncbi:MAG: hypothetical protein JSV08_03030 [Acidobacteriota bacterium]|nr:MAG: hypothetical protein JSV08_03030 [Acidobacteriota bacterium]